MFIKILDRFAYRYKRLDGLVFCFFYTYKVVFEAEVGRLHLPEYQAPGDGSDLLLAFVPAVLGARGGHRTSTRLPARRRDGRPERSRDQSAVTPRRRPERRRHRAPLPGPRLTERPRAPARSL